MAQPTRLKLWPLESRRYGLDATFDGHWGCEDAEQHAGRLARWGMASVIRPAPEGGWTVRLGPLNSLDVARALAYLLRVQIGGSSPPIHRP
jgi:hypothetical protein